VTSARPTSPPGQTQSAGGPGGAPDTRIKRSAWLLASFALVFYVGYIAYYFWRSAAGG
jgi:hypothetical protein